MMTLFACLVMNNWNMYVEGFATASGPGAYAFFVTWWVVGVLLGLNLVTSVVLDAFVDQWGALHSAEGSQDAQGDRVAFDAGVITGTRTGVSGQWIARSGSAAWQTGSLGQRMLALPELQTTPAECAA